MAAVFPVASGSPEYSGTMIPEVWSAKLLVKFYLATVFGEIANTDYEGEISAQGDTVHIRNTPDVTINDYVKGQKLNYETPEPSTTDLLIDKGKSWSFMSNYVDEAQADYDYVNDWTADASKQMAIKIDKQILDTVFADAATANKGLTAGAVSSGYNMGTTGSPVAVDATNVVDLIADMGSIMDEQNIPEEGRWVVAPSWFCNKVKKSDLKDASLSGDGQSIARNGRIGIVDRMPLYSSNQVNSVTDGARTAFNIMFGHMSAITFASQLTENEGPMKHPDYFGNFYRGLQVYGFKTIKPEGMGVLYAYQG